MYTNRKKEDKQGNDKMIKKIENICTEEERVVPTTQPRPTQQCHGIKELVFQMF